MGRTATYSKRFRDTPTNHCSLLFSLPLDGMPHLSKCRLLACPLRFRMRGEESRDYLRSDKNSTSRRDHRPARNTRCCCRCCCRCCGCCCCYHRRRRFLAYRWTSTPFVTSPTAYCSRSSRSCTPRQQSSVRVLQQTRYVLLPVFSLPSPTWGAPSAPARSNVCWMILFGGERISVAT